MKQKTSKSKFAIAVMLIFSAFSLLLVGIFALNTSFQMKVRMPLNVTKNFTLTLNIGSNTYQIFDNTQKTATLQSWVTTDGVRIYLNGAGNPLSSITSSTSVSLTITNLTEKYMEFALEDLATDHENGITLGPNDTNDENLSNTGEIVIFHDQITEDFSIRPLVECYDGDPTTYDVTITNATSSVVRATENEDFITYLTASTTHFATIESITVGGTAITNYSYAMQTGRLVIPAGSVTGAIAITCGTKIKYINADLTLQTGITARYNSTTYSNTATADATYQISNHLTTLNLVLFLDNTSTSNTAWCFDIKLDGKTFYDYDWNVSSYQKVLTLNHEALTADITISITSGVSWDGTVATAPNDEENTPENIFNSATANTSGGVDYTCTSPTQLAYLAQEVNAGDAYENDSIIIENDIYLNDEIFTFDDQTGLVKVTDGKNTIYIGTKAYGLTYPDVSGNNLESTAGAYYTKLANGTYQILTNAPSTTALDQASTDLVHTVQNSSGNNLSVQYRSSTSNSWSLLNEWTPIGTSTYKFQGSADGNANNIVGMFFNNEKSCQGFFGYTSTSWIQSMSFKGGCILGGWQLGNVLGRDNGPIVSVKNIEGNNIVVQTAMHPTAILNGRCSGVVGDLYYGGQILNCHNAGVVISNFNGVGGVTGLAIGGVVNCYNVGDIYAEKGKYTGGVIGQNGTTGTGVSYNCYLYNTYNLGLIHNNEGTNQKVYGIKSSVAGDEQHNFSPTEITSMAQLLTDLNSWVAKSNNTNVCKWKEGENGYPVHDYTSYFSGSLDYHVQFNLNYSDAPTSFIVDSTTYYTSEVYSYTYGTSVALPQPTRTGYDFKGWTPAKIGTTYKPSNNSGTNLVYLGAANDANEPYVLYAYWVAE